MFRLEHGAADRGTLQKALPTLSHIQEAQSAWRDDFALNSLLRRKFRVSPGGGRHRTRGGCVGTGGTVLTAPHLQEKKKAQQEEEQRDQALQAKASLAIPLVPETNDDRRLATLLKFHTLDCAWGRGVPGLRGCGARGCRAQGDCPWSLSDACASLRPDSLRGQAEAEEDRDHTPLLVRAQPERRQQSPQQRPAEAGPGPPRRARPQPRRPLPPGHRAPAAPGRARKPPTPNWHLRDEGSAEEDCPGQARNTPRLPTGHIPDPRDWWARGRLPAWDPPGGGRAPGPTATPSPQLLPRG